MSGSLYFPYVLYLKAEAFVADDRRGCENKLEVKKRPVFCIPTEKQHILFIKPEKTLFFFMDLCYSTTEGK